MTYTEAFAKDLTPMHIGRIIEVRYENDAGRKLTVVGRLASYRLNGVGSYADVVIADPPANVDLGVRWSDESNPLPYEMRGYFWS